MFHLFKRKSELEKLNLKYQNLLEEAHKYSNINRRLSDEKIAESDKVLIEIETLQKKSE